LLGWTLQLQQHVVHGKIFCDGAAIIPSVCFGTLVAGKQNSFIFVNSLRDKGPGMPP
jgi:hypothetical protein